MVKKNLRTFDAGIVSPALLEFLLQLSTLFQLINKRYEKSTTIITTNQPFSKWAETFGDAVLANAILDRLLHHSYIFNINGKSYRTKDIIDTENDDIE